MLDFKFPRSRLKGSIEIARVDFTNRDADLTDCFAKRFGQLLALFVEIPLLGNVIEIEGIGISLIRKCRAMSDPPERSDWTSCLGSRIRPSGPWDCAEDGPIRVNTRLVTTTRQPTALLKNMLISFLRDDMSARGAVILLPTVQCHF